MIDQLNRRAPIAALILALLPTTHVSQVAAQQLEEVVVTARKRAENLQKTPVSITALTAAAIDDAKLFNIKDIESLTPNLNFIVGSDGSGSTLQAFIRGIGQFDFAVTTDPGVGVYVDGVYLARSIGANMEFSDVERISVLRGPQGTLFGKNTIGGAINVVTRAPSGETNYSAEVTAGEDSYLALDAYAEFPIADNLAGSVSVLWKEYDGWQKRDRGDNAGNNDMYGIRAHLNWDVSEMWNSHFIADTVSQDQNVYPRVLSDFDSSQFYPALYNNFVLSADESCCTPNLSDIDRSDVLNEDRDELDTLGLSWINTWDFDGMTLKSTTGYREMEAEMLRDSDNSEKKYFEVETAFDTTQFSQEFLLSNTTDGAVDWLIGGYYFTEDADHYTGVTVADGLYEALIGLPPAITAPNGAPLSVLAPFLDLTLDYDRTQKTTSYAAFFSTTWHVSDQMRVNVAARYTQEKKELETFTLKRASQIPIATPGPTTPSECSDVTPQGNGSVFSCEEEWSEFSPKIGVDYEFSDDVLGYAHISRGFRSGVFNGRPISTEEISVADPEIVTSYEMGFKSQLWDQKLQLNGAVFYNDYEDQQFLVNQSNAASAAGLILLVDNAGKSTLTGAELEFTVLPAEGFTLSGSMAWLDPEYDRFEQVDFITGDVQDLSNREFRDVPEWTASLMAQYEWQLNDASTVRLRSDASYRDDIFYSNEPIAGFDRLHADSFITYNAGVTYIPANSNWEFGVYGRNLSDEREIIGGFGVDAFGTTDVAFTEPRRFFVSVKYSGGDS